MDCVDQDRDRQAFVDSAALLDVILKVSQHVRFQLNEWLGQFELNDGRFGVMSALSYARDRGLSQADLAEILGQSASNVSTLMERMARDGLATRLQSETDRRKRMWSISLQGQRQLESVEAKRSAWAARMFEVMTAQEQQTLITLLQKFDDNEEASLKFPTIAVASTSVAEGVASTDNDRQLDPVSDPASPQFALRQMLLALSSSAAVELRDEREAA